MDRTWTQVIAAAGLLVTLGGFGAFAAFLYTISLDENARRFDLFSENMSSGECRHALRNAVPPTRTPVIGEAMVVTMAFLNDNPEFCDVEVSLTAAGFDKDPQGPARYNLKPGNSEHF